MHDGLIIVKAKITLKTKEEGGRETAFYSGYRPNHVFELPNNLKILLAYIGAIQFPDRGSFAPGETKIVTVRFLNVPEIKKYMTVGRKWCINEGPKTIGFGEILDIQI